MHVGSPVNKKMLRRGNERGVNGVRTANVFLAESGRDWKRFNDYLSATCNEISAPSLLWYSSIMILNIARASCYAYTLKDHPHRSEDAALCTASVIKASIGLSRESFQSTISVVKRMLPRPSYCMQLRSLALTSIECRQLAYH